MEARATARYVRVSPRKARQTVDLIRGKSVKEALAILRFSPKMTREPVQKVLQSAVANAENNLDLSREDLIVSAAWVDQGPTLKRIQPRARGSADLVRKHTSHITVVVGEKKEG